MKVPLLLISMLSLFLAHNTIAESISGIHFTHNDWEIACDNTRTCRAAGYQSDEDELSISVLLTRKAGAQQPVIGELMIGEMEAALPSSVEMKINNKSIGFIIIDPNNSAIQLSELQVNALLKALLQTSDIQFISGSHAWHLSDQGAAAVLLKMDEFQGRIDTQGALVRKGKKSEAHVLPELSAPIVFAAATINKQPNDEDRKILISALKKAINKDDCSDFFESDIEHAEFNAYSLTTTQWLVSTRCWQGAYNSGYGYWVINQQMPHNVVFVTESGTDYSNGVISASQKGRGLGDCWSSESWVWDGKQFVQSEITTSGMCKLVAAGGAWPLPTFISDVRRYLPK
jgi:hypothetical protein